MMEQLLDASHVDRFIERASKVLPMGTSSPLRACRNVEAAPLIAAAAYGDTIVDVDGNEYTDFVFGFGPAILGHSHPQVVSAIHEQAKRGSVLATGHRLEIELAETILCCCPGLSKIRFLSTGTEAVMSAVRLARASTGKLGILRMKGGYHGHCDLAQSPSDSALRRGLNPAEMEQVTAIPAGDIDALDRTFEQLGARLGAALIEPIACNDSLREIPIPFLRRLRELCNQHNVVLIFDEVITGFRFRYGPIYPEIGVTPDIVTFGKIIGGGLPAGAVVGTERVMSLLERQIVYQGGTFSGNPLTMAAGLETLKILSSKAPYSSILDLAKPLHELSDELRAAGSELIIRTKAGVFAIDFAGGRASREKQYTAMYNFARSNGIHLAPDVDEVMYISASSSGQSVGKLVCVLRSYADSPDSVLRRFSDGQLG